MTDSTPTRREEMRVRGLQEIMQSANGRAWMHDVLHTRCHLMSGSHVAGCSDSTAFNEGARAIGTALVQDLIEIYPQHYLKMLSESQ